MRQMPKLWTCMSNTWIGRRRNKARVFPGFTGFLSRLLVQRCGSEGARNRTFTARPSQSHGARTQLRPRAGAPRKTPRLTEGRPRGAAVFSARPCPAGAPPRRAAGRVAVKWRCGSSPCCSAAAGRAAAAAGLAGGSAQVCTPRSKREVAVVSLGLPHVQLQCREVKRGSDKVRVRLRALPASLFMRNCRRGGERQEVSW